MNLSDLVSYRCELESMSTVSLSREVDINVEKITHLVSNQPIQLAEFSKQLANQKQGIQQAFDNFEQDLNILKQQLNALIETSQKPWFAESYRLYEQEMIHETAEYILSRRAEISAETEQFYRNRIVRYNNWKHPAMVIRPGRETYLNELLASDPLYLVDESHDLLAPALNLFNERYQNRLRSYTINERNSEKILDKQPGHGQGFAAGAGDVPGLLAAGRGLPFVVAAGWQDAAPAPKGLAERRLLGHGFGPCVVQLVADRGVPGPVRHQAPAHQLGDAFALLGLVHHGHGRLRRYVPPPREGSHPGQAEACDQGLRVIGNDVAATHGADVDTALPRPGAQRRPPGGGPTRQRHRGDGGRNADCRPWRHPTQPLNAPSPETRHEPPAPPLVPPEFHAASPACGPRRGRPSRRRPVPGLRLVRFQPRVADRPVRQRAR